jgi:carboxyl-terminal processing protease
MLKQPVIENRARARIAPRLRARWLVPVGIFLSGCSLNRAATGSESESAQEAVAPANGPSVGQQGADNSPEVSEILEKHIAAIGGRDAQDAIKTVDTEREAELFKVVRKTHEIRDKATQRFYSKTDDPNGTIEMGYDGKRAWQKSPFFKGYLAESDPTAKTLSRKRPELYQYKETKQRFVRLANETIEGKQLIVLQTRSTDFDPLGREIPVKYYFLPDSFLLRRMVMGAEVTQTIDFDDYREVDGTMVPFVSTATNPNVTVKSKIKHIQYNTPVDPAIFEYQPRGAPDAGSGSSATEVGSATTTTTAALPVATQGDGTLNEKVRLDTFELVWSTINDTYWDPAFGGVDWKAIHDKYLPRVKATERSDEYHQLLNDMLAELDRSHLSVVTPDKVQGLHSKASELRNGSVGLDLRWLDGELAVFDTKKDFPAARAGIKRGFRIARINGKDVDRLLADYKRKRGGFPLRAEIERVRAAVDELGGVPNTELTLEVAGRGPATKLVKLSRRAKPPNQAMEFESKTLQNNIGYMRFSIFFGDVLTKTAEALRQLRDTSGLIIDLRGNPGGAGDLTDAVANLLCPQPGTLGSSASRYGNRQHAYAGSGKEAYPGKVLILVDEMTGSAAEVFSGGLQENKRATIVGATTAGAVLPSVMNVLPTGASLLHAIADFKTPNGTILEGRGVVPDISVKPRRAAWLGGHDPALDAAIRFLSTPVAAFGR